MSSHSCWIRLPALSDLRVAGAQTPSLWVHPLPTSSGFSIAAPAVQKICLSWQFSLFSLPDDPYDPGRISPTAPLDEKALSTLFRDTPKLEKLNLTGCTLPFGTLVAALRSASPTLTTLCVGGTEAATNELIDALDALVPTLRWLDVFSESWVSSDRPKLAALARLAHRLQSRRALSDWVGNFQLTLVTCELPSCNLRSVRVSLLTTHVPPQANRPTRGLRRASGTKSASPSWRFRPRKSRTSRRSSPSARRRTGRLTSRSHKSCLNPPDCAPVRPVQSRRMAHLRHLRRVRPAPRRHLRTRARSCSAGCGPARTNSRSSTLHGRKRSGCSSGRGARTGCRAPACRSTRGSRSGTSRASSFDHACCAFRCLYPRMHILLAIFPISLCMAVVVARVALMRAAARGGARCDATRLAALKR